MRSPNAILNIVTESFNELCGETINNEFAMAIDTADLTPHERCWADDNLELTPEIKIADINASKR